MSDSGSDDGGSSPFGCTSIDVVWHVSIDVSHFFFERIVKLISHLKI